jgi:hypothetical protein
MSTLEMSLDVRSEEEMKKPEEDGIRDNNILIKQEPKPQICTANASPVSERKEKEGGEKRREAVSTLTALW